VIFWHVLLWPLAQFSTDRFVSATLPLVNSLDHLLGSLKFLYVKALNEAEEVTLRTGQYWWQAEIHRLQGELYLQHATPNLPGVESCFQQALDVARQQQARSLELRAATSYARLWQNQGKRQRAYDLLAPIYGWFTEGFDTADLKDSKALLDELS